MAFARAGSRALYHLCMSSAAVLTAPLLTLALVSCGGGPESGTSGPGRSARAVPYTLSSPETDPAALGETHAAPAPPDGFAAITAITKLSGPLRAALHGPPELPPLSVGRTSRKP